MIRLDTPGAARAWARRAEARARAQQARGGLARLIVDGLPWPFDRLELATRRFHCSRDRGGCGARPGEFCMAETGLAASGPHHDRLRKLLANGA